MSARTVGGGVAEAAATWHCELCGFVYDEALGCPAEGFAAGTRWPDIPETWGCPVCGQSKADFTPLDLG